jgi:hypothetical protein
MSTTVMMEESPKAKEEPNKKRPIPDEESWNLLLETYRKVKNNTDNEHDVALFERIQTNGRCGARVPFEVRQAPGKGRGVFATAFIPKQTCVWECRSGRFVTETQMQSFLQALPLELSQDVATWAFVDDLDDDGIMAVYLDFDESALLNDGASIPRNWLVRIFCPCKNKNKRRNENYTPDAPANLHEHVENGRWCYYSSQDIESGEELLCDYTDFHDYEHELEWWDKLEQKYWPEE